MALSDKPVDGQRYEPVLQQTRDWADAREVVAHCRASLLVTDFLASRLQYKTRLALFHSVLLSVLDLAPCLAIHWQPSQRLVQPEAYLSARRADEPDPLFPGVNVRLFRVEDRAPGEMVMDTLGLAALGVPDLQCHFVELDPNAVATMLHNSAYYLFERGDVIEDGHTIQGIGPNPRWRCRHEMALVEPERVVIDVNPGPPYVAGNRN